MRLTDDSGQTLRAEYSVTADGDHIAVILESLSGRGSGKPARNQDYRLALELILKRLRERQAVIRAALVDSQRTQHLPERDRSLLQEPVRLVDLSDIGALRRRLTEAQRTIGQAPDARGGGNSTRRIRLRLTIPGYGPADAERLAADLATASAPTTAPESDGWALDARWTDLPARLSHPPAGDAGDDPSNTKRSGGSGHLNDQERKLAIERYAVHVAMTHYREIEGYDVEGGSAAGPRGLPIRETSGPPGTRTGHRRPPTNCPCRSTSRPKSAAEFHDRPSRRSWAREPVVVGHRHTLPGRRCSTHLSLRAADLRRKEPMRSGHFAQRVVHRRRGWLCRTVSTEDIAGLDDRETIARWIRGMHEGKTQTVAVHRPWDRSSSGPWDALPRASRLTGGHG